jgi:competence protein ComEA
MKRTPIFAILLLAFSLFSGIACAEPPSVNINTATAETLTSLDGVGEAKAQAIVTYRSENGAFESADDLTAVSGIGERTLEKNADRVTVE